MKNICKNISELMFKINEKLEPKAFTIKDIKDENKYYNDFVKTKTQLRDLINSLNEKNINIDLMRDDLINLHVLLCDLNWYFYNLHENVKKIIKNLPDRT